MGEEDKRKLLLIVDSMDAIRDEVSLASFVAGFKLAWGISRELETDGLYSYDEEEMTQPWRRSQDNGKEKKIVPLEKPYEGLYVANNMWREMFDFSSDAVLMVLASELYDEEDYIRDYDEFLEFIKKDYTENK